MRDVIREQDREGVIGWVVGYVRWWVGRWVCGMVGGVVGVAMRGWVGGWVGVPSSVSTISEACFHSVNATSFSSRSFMDVFVACTAA